MATALPVQAGSLPTPVTDRRAADLATLPAPAAPAAPAAALPLARAPHGDSPAKPAHPAASPLLTPTLTPPSRRPAAAAAPGPAAAAAMDTDAAAQTPAQAPVPATPAPSHASAAASLQALPVWSPNEGLRTLASVVPSPFSQPPAPKRGRPPGASSVRKQLRPAAPAEAGPGAASPSPASRAKQALEMASPATAAAAMALTSTAAKSAGRLSRAGTSPGLEAGLSPVSPMGDDGIFPLEPDDGDAGYSRKQKSLSLLCRKYGGLLARARSGGDVAVCSCSALCRPHPPSGLACLSFSDMYRGREGQEISIDSAAVDLSTAEKPWARGLSAAPGLTLGRGPYRSELPQACRAAGSTTLSTCSRA